MPKSETKDHPTLKLASHFDLPLDAATRRMAILAMSGAGKSNAAVVMAEQMFDAGIPWVAIDPKGDWWGVRSGKSGKRSGGLPIPIFGGLAGDVTLEPGAGKLIGELIVEQRLTCVLDVSEFPDRQAMWGFLTDLGETLLRKNRQPLHIFCEECDEYLPQKPSEKGNLLKCLSVWQRVVKRGRFRGIGTTQITQRSASLHKDTLYQAEVLFAMRVTGKGDRAAIAGYVEHHNAAGEIVASLPTLEDGEAWMTSPAWLRDTKRLKFHRRRTFDSGSTPVLLHGKTPAATLADIDLDVLRTRMAETIEKAKAEDPAELRKANAELAKQLDAAKKAADAALTKLETVQGRADTATGKAEVSETRQELRKARKALEEAMKFLISVQAFDFKPGDKAALEQAVTRAVGKIVTSFEERLTMALGKVDGLKQTAARVEKLVKELKDQDVGVEVRVQKQEPFTIAVPKARAAAESKPTAPIDLGDRKVSVPQQVLLNSLAWLESVAIEQPRRGQLALVAKVSASSSGFEKNVSTLRTLGLVDFPVQGAVTLTPGGRALAVRPATPPTATELHESLVGRVSTPQGHLLRVLIAVYPAQLSREELAARVNVSDSSSGFEKNVSTLRSLGLAEFPVKGFVKAAGVLFLDIA